MARYAPIGIQCPACGEYESAVISVKLDIERNTRNRLRICMRCGAKIPTVERIDMLKFKRENKNKRYHNV
jgi:transcriptional regulator NrdR family protein